MEIFQLDFDRIMKGMMKDSINLKEINLKILKGKVLYLKKIKNNLKYKFLGFFLK